MGLETSPPTAIEAADGELAREERSAAPLLPLELPAEPATAMSLAAARTSARRGLPVDLILWSGSWATFAAAYGWIFGAASGLVFGVIAGMFLGPLWLRGWLDLSTARTLRLFDGELFCAAILSLPLPVAAVALGGRTPVGLPLLLVPAMLLGPLGAGLLVLRYRERRPADVVARLALGYAAVFGGGLLAALGCSIALTVGLTVQQLPFETIAREALFQPIALRFDTPPSGCPGVWSATWAIFGGLMGLAAGMLHRGQCELASPSLPIASNADDGEPAAAGEPAPAVDPIDHAAPRIAEISSPVTPDDPAAPVPPR